MVKHLLAFALLAVPTACVAEQPKETFDILVEATDCGGTLRVPTTIRLALGEAERIRTESFERRSSIALEVSMNSSAAFRATGFFLTPCGDTPIDISAPIGDTAAMKSGDVSVAVTLSRAAANNSFKGMPLRGTP